MDIVVSCIGLAVLSPLFLLLAVLVRFRLGRPILFCQKRPGLAGRAFFIYKFRTMTDAAGSDGRVLADRERLTSFGEFLRRSSLDELPELLNVLRGDMSLVGPRPLMMKYIDRYTSEQARRHEVKPGITGWAQVNGRNAISWEDKFTLDVWYVDNWSLWIDLKVLAKSAILILTQRGVTQKGRATVDEFMGTQQRTGPCGGAGCTGQI